MRPLATAATTALLCLLISSSAGAQPDLDLAWWNVDTSSVQGYQSQISVSFGVSNGILSAPAGPFYVGFYYGDTAGTSGLTYLGSTYFSGLGTGATKFYTQIVTMPATALRGSRYLHYYIDYSGMVAETNETNNRGSRAISVTGWPDLRVTTLGVTPSSAAPGSTLNVTYRLYNAGYTRAPAAFATRFYYSANSAISTADTYLNRQITTSSLLARAYAPASANGSTTVTVPAGAALGTRYIGAIADYNNVVAESTESNNTRAAAFSVANPAELQLLAWSTNVGAVPGYGSQVQISFSLRNNGGAAGPFYVRFYYGNTSATSGLTLLTSRYVSGLGAGATSATLQQTVTLPASVLYGTRYLHYFVDATALVAESNEGNNRGSRTLGITSRPDLRVTTLGLSPGAAAPGAGLTATYRLYNAGYSRVAGTYYTRFYYSTDSTITSADTYLNRQLATANLLARAYAPASANGSTTVTLPAGATPGTRYIGAITDVSNVVTESVETNNTRAAALTVGGSNGVACSAGSQCLSGFCVDGVCCSSACGGSVTSDCRACSTAAGGSANGTCTLLPSTRVCRLAAGVCDKAESCTGASAACPANSFKPASTVCRTAAGVCDKAESCSGSAAACPANSFKPASTVCRTAAGICDEAESCSGSAAACPADSFKPASTVCRTAAGICDATESCSGGAASCPTDLLKPDGTPCAGGICASGICKPKPADLGPPDGAPDGGADGAADQGGDLASSDLASDGSAALDSASDALPADVSPTADSAALAEASTTVELGVSESGPRVDVRSDSYAPYDYSKDGCSCELGGRGAVPTWPLWPALVVVGWIVTRRRIRARS